MHRKTGNMKIQHTTYEESHDAQANLSSIGQKLKRLFTCGSCRTGDAERPKRQDSACSLTEHEQLTAWLRKEAKARKAKKNTEKPSRASEPVPALCRTSSPPLILTSRTTDSNKATLGVEELKAIRTMMRDGTIEKVVPPLSSPPPCYMPQMVHPPASLARARRSRPTSTLKSKSSAKKLVEYFAVSADLLDERRRDFTGKLPATFRGLRSDSDEDFFCVGEDGEDTDDPFVFDKDRRFSGPGTSPWTDTSSGPSSCRRCKILTYGFRGLCARCALTPSSSFDDYAEDFRPTPPLKDMKSPKIEGTRSLVFDRPMGRMERDEGDAFRTWQNIAMRRQADTKEDEQYGYRGQGRDSRSHLSWGGVLEEDGV